MLIAKAFLKRVRLCVVRLMRPPFGGEPGFVLLNRRALTNNNVAAKSRNSTLCDVSRAEDMSNTHNAATVALRFLEQ